MSGLKTEIMDKESPDNLCLDQYHDGSVRLICNEEFIGMDGIVNCYKGTAHIHLTKREMTRLIAEYLKNEIEWGSLAEDDI